MSLLTPPKPCSESAPPSANIPETETHIIVSGNEHTVYGGDLSITCIADITDMSINVSNTKATENQKVIFSQLSTTESNIHTSNPVLFSNTSTVEPDTVIPNSSGINALLISKPMSTI